MSGINGITEITGITGITGIRVDVADASMFIVWCKSLVS